MLAIHGIWADGALSLWAEDPAEPGTSGPGNTAGRPAPHPFAAPAVLLADVLAEYGEPAGDLARKAAEAELTLWLPGTATSGPLPSPELAEASDLSSRQPPNLAPGRTKLTPWQVPALTFAPADALGVLTAISHPATAAERGVLSGTIHYLAALAALAADLTARGRVLPGFEAAADGRYLARWRPVLAGPDALRARELTVAIPPVCRAISEAGAPSADIVTEVLNLLTDAAVRTALAAEPGFSVLPGPARDQLTDRWAAALTGEDGEVSVPAGDAAKAAQLTFALWAWQDAAQEPPGPVRTCFRLTEPAVRLPAGDQEAGDQEASEGGGGSWRVELALQATDDPSLLLPAADIWSGGSADGWAAAGINFPEDDLLAGLGRASRLFPELDRELQRAAPESVELDTGGALNFLKETGPLLAGAGFGVLLPDWVRRSRLGLKLTTRSRSAGGPGSVTAPQFGLSELVDFRYELAVGEQTLDADELAELARLKVPLVRLRGQWVELDERHLKAALSFLERGASGTMTAGAALLAGLGAGSAELPLTEVAADGWLGDLLSGQADARLAPVSTPASFQGELRPYQERGLAWLSFLGRLGLGAVLADDMGLGKSPQTLALLQAERDDATATGPTLLVCPMSLVGNWQREAAKFTPGLTVHVHHGAGWRAGPSSPRP